METIELTGKVLAFITAILGAIGAYLHFRRAEQPQRTSDEVPPPTGANIRRSYEVSDDELTDLIAKLKYNKPKRDQIHVWFGKEKVDLDEL